MRRRIQTDDLYGKPAGSDAFIFDSVIGVPIRGDCTPPFRTYGRPVHHVGPMEPRAFGVLELWVAELQRLSGRTIDAIVACSVWRPYTKGSPTRHAEGKAIDVGGIWWSERDGVTAWEYGSRRKMAVAIEATMRLVWGTVLGPTSNQRHLNHWHLDCGKRPAITVRELAQSAKGKRMVEVVYLQEACSEVHGIPLVLDGIWGAKTLGAIVHVLRDMDYGPIPDITRYSVYEAFLIATALRGFNHVEQLAQVSRDT